MKPEWMSLAFLHIGWLSAVVGEARLQSKRTKHATTALLVWINLIWKVEDQRRQILQKLNHFVYYKYPDKFEITRSDD